MSELFREIEEDIRAERAQRLWQRFGKQMVWLSVAIVAGTAAGVLWRDYRSSSAMKDTNQLIKGVSQYEAQDYKAAIATLGALKPDTAAGAIALLHKAKAQSANGDKEAAKKTLMSLAEQPGKDVAIFANLARAQLGAGEASIAKDAPLSYTLRENKAWQLIEQGKKDEAVALFADLYYDRKAPQGMKQRLLLALQRFAPEKLNEKPGNV